MVGSDQYSWHQPQCHTKRTNTLQAEKKKNKNKNKTKQRIEKKTIRVCLVCVHHTSKWLMSSLCSLATSCNLCPSSRCLCCMSPIFRWDATEAILSWSSRRDTCSDALRTSSSRAWEIKDRDSLFTILHYLIHQLLGAWASEDKPELKSEIIISTSSKAGPNVLR